MIDINEFLLNKLDKLDEKLDDIKVNQVSTHTALQNHEQRDEEIHSDVKKMGSEVATQSKLLSEYNESLKEHMRRTRLLEDKVDPMYKEWADDKVVKKHKMKTWKKVVAWLGAAATAVGLIAGIINLMGLL